MNEITKINSSKKVTNEISLRIRGKEYQEITYDDGEIILRTYNHEYKMWVTLRFAKEDDAEILEKVIKYASDIIIPSNPVIFENRPIIGSEIIKSLKTKMKKHSQITCDDNKN